ncbi:hypothetical protein N0V88_004258 [Collariella sp. IMI 366227]|nr:hypothetical protein N0V88_004258 [Collariella sp. IMI 366227]
MAAATLFTNGKIFLSGVKPGANAGLDREPTFASCLLIRGSQIEHVGTAADEPITAALADTSTAVHNLQGKTILPGFVDGHMHLMLLGQALNKLDLGKCKTLTDIQATIKAYSAATPDAQRILCRGRPTWDGLDATGKDRPILVDSKDLHSTWCNNSAVIELGAEKWADVPGGVIERDAEGKLTGVFSEAANITYVWPYLASVASMEERMAAIKAAVAAYHESGYTGMIDMAMDEGAWEALQALRSMDGGVPMRIAAYWLVKPCDEVEEMLKQVERAAELAKEFNASSVPDCRVVGIKVICDGIVDACTAGLSEPYAHNGHVEVPLWTPEQLEPVVKRADERGLQVALHAIGDATVKMVVDMLTNFTSPGRRPRVEHLEVTTEEDAVRLGKGCITASIQPVHADPAILKAWPRLLGEHRCGRAFAYRQFADLGEPEMETTVNPHFALGLCEAVAAATQGAAYSCFDDHRIGAIENGHKADFVVVDMEWEKEKLMQAKVTETWFEGGKVWSA